MPARRARRPAALLVGPDLLLRGEAARANGWFGRAERLLERERDDCVEQGYLLVPALLAQVGRDDEAACATAAQAAAIGERFGDRDLVALVVQEQGHALVRLGRVEQGLRLIDETMVAVVAGELSPIVTGLVYCNTIAFCQGALELRPGARVDRRAGRWCERQPDMVAHTGVCLVHRAEILELAGDWDVALEEARRAGERFRGRPPPTPATRPIARPRSTACAGTSPLPRRPTARRAAAGSSRSPASPSCDWRKGAGTPPRPGSAGRSPRPRIRCDACAAPGVRRDHARGRRRRGRASGERELERLAARHDSGMVRALAAHAAGAVALAEGDAGAALTALRRACAAWQELGVPYEAARARVLVGARVPRLGDEDAAALELEAAGDTFARLGAADEWHGRPARTDAPHGHGLTPRQLEVLRLVAAGQTNREIAAALVISEHTVARHVQNILATLRLRSRTAAGAFAFEHDLSTWSEMTTLAAHAVG